VTFPASAPTSCPAPDPGTSSGPALELLVGERTVPQLRHENYWFRRHEIAYLALAPTIVAEADRSGDFGRSATEPGHQAVVVEAGCGEGYGVALLNRAGVGRLAALDYDPNALRHAQQAYPEVPGRALRTNLAHLPLADGCAAAVVSFQVLEHLWTPWEFLAECARVLRPGGLLVLSTPNRPTFSPGLGRGQKPANPYHVREFDAAELVETVAGHLEVEQVLGVSPGRRLAGWEAEHGSLVAAQLAAPHQEWSKELAAQVESVRAGDFTLAPMTDADDERVLDLVVLARRPVS
jgi:SAM-dependent methyltransferase